MSWWFSRRSAKSTEFVAEEVASEDGEESDAEQAAASSVEEPEAGSQQEVDGSDHHGSKSTTAPRSSLPVGFSDEERRQMKDLGSSAGESSMRLYRMTAHPRWKSFLLHAGWPSSSMKDPWTWLNESGEPINGIFERFFKYLEKDAKDTTAGTFVRAGCSSCSNSILLRTFIC